MITPAYCVTMARYNAWQNKQMTAAMAQLDAEALLADRGAFFGSILGTANHLLWGDVMWLSRLSDHPKPEVSGEDSPRFMPTFAAWQAERYRTDAKLILWAEKLRALDLTGDLTWTRGFGNEVKRRPMSLVLAHVFNHQTHHRGQIHAMLTAAGVKTEDTDLILLSDEGPWL